jgi:hypothetical protein
MVSLITTLLGAGLFYTGRGLSRHAMWARIAGGLLSLAALLVSGEGVLAFERGGATISLPLACAAAYTAWVLGWRFS